MATKSMPFNLNGNMTVTLTQRGVDMYNQHFADLDIEVPKVVNKGDGYTAVGWWVMHVWGPALSHGAAPPFDMNVLIHHEVEKDKEVEPFKVKSHARVKDEAWTRFWSRYAQKVPHPGPQLVFDVGDRGVKLAYPSVWWQPDELEHCPMPEEDKTRQAAKENMKNLMDELRTQAGVTDDKS